MNYAKIKHYDPANGPGIRLSLFVSGCYFHCPGCFNIEAQDFNYGKPYTQQTSLEIIKNLNSNEYDGLSILGGDPLWQTEESIQLLIDLCQSVHNLNKNVWLWTGFAWENIFNPLLKGTNSEVCQQLVKNCDVIVDGQYDESKRDLRLLWRGSSNQRVIDVKQTLHQNKIILWENLYLQFAK